MASSGRARMVAGYAWRLLPLAAAGTVSYLVYYLAHILAARGGVVYAYYGGLAAFGARLLGAPAALLLARYWSTVPGYLAEAIYATHPVYLVVLVAASLFIDESIYWESLFSMLTVSLLAGGVYAVLPTAPPWMALPGLERAARVLIRLGGEPDPYASFPSLHVAYAVLGGYYLYRLTGRRWLRVLAALWPPLMLLVTLYTGNHYLVDGLAGALLAVSTVIAYRLLARLAWSRTG